jgi:hypothetical protein
MTHVPKLHVGIRSSSLQSLENWSRITEYTFPMCIQIQQSWLWVVFLWTLNIHCSTKVLPSRKYYHTENPSARTKHVGQLETHCTVRHSKQLNVYSQFFWTVNHSLHQLAHRASNPQQAANAMRVVDQTSWRVVPPSLALPRRRRNHDNCVNHLFQTSSSRTLCFRTLFCFQVHTQRD